ALKKHPPCCRRGVDRRTHQQQGPFRFHKKEFVGPRSAKKRQWFRELPQDQCTDDPPPHCESRSPHKRRRKGDCAGLPPWASSKAGCATATDWSGQHPGSEKRAFQAESCRMWV